MRVREFLELTENAAPDVAVFPSGNEGADVVFDMLGYSDVGTVEEVVNGLLSPAAAGNFFASFEDSHVDVSELNVWAVGKARSITSRQISNAIKIFLKKRTW